MSLFRRKTRLAATGSRAPDFDLQLPGGGRETLASLCRKGPFVLAFFKVTCPVCQLALPFLERMRKSGSLPVFAVSQHDAELTAEFHQEFGLQMPTLLDTEEGGFAASNAFGISSVPTIFLIEAGGGISQVIEGWHKGDMTALAGRAGAEIFRQGENVPAWKAG
jgi:peroxiredoxin